MWKKTYLNFIYDWYKTDYVLRTYVIGSEKTCHVDNYFLIILFMIIIEHLLIYRMHFILFYLNIRK